MLGSTGQNMLLSQNNPTAASFPFMGMVGMMNSTNLMPALNPNPAVPNVDTSSHVNKSFLIQLHDLLTKEHQDIIVWEADGLKFSIKDIMRFRSVVLPKCFPSMSNCELFSIALY